MARQLGIVLGVALLVTVLGTPSHAAALAAFGRGYVLTAILAGVAGVAALALITSRRPAAAPPAPAPARAQATPGTVTPEPMPE
jgi:NTE family protein